jgi:hypothetical protein
MHDDPDSNKSEISYLDMYVAAHIKYKKRVDDLLNQVNAFCFVPFGSLFLVIACPT